MIHSMSGGVLSEYDTYTFAKVKFDGCEKPCWFISDFEVKEDDRVLAPYGAGSVGRSGTVLKVETNVSGQVAPVPLKRVKKLLCKLTWAP